MTPEQKARGIVRDWFGFDLDDDLPSDHDLAKIIATALREARNAALEEAAAIAQSFDCADARKSLPNEAITAALGVAVSILALKDKQEVTEEGGA